MHAECEPHAATWLSWPRKEGISFPERFESIPRYWVQMCELLSPHEEIHINVRDETHEEEARCHLGQSKTLRKNRIFLHPFGINECWCRDHGPMFLVNRANNDSSPTTAALAIVDWDYNAWGGKYPPYDLDDAIPAKIAGLLGLPLFQPGIVMEGGAIDVNGRGTLLTTESCLLNKNRNPRLTKGQIEGYLKDYLGVTNLLWLGEGIVGDDTDGHVDDITRFVNATTVVTAVEEDPADANFKPLQENLNRLRQMKDQEGRSLRVIELPMPGFVEHNGQRLPASYLNFYIGNKAVLVPIYSHQNDSKALEILSGCFPHRQVENSRIKFPAPS